MSSEDYKNRADAMNKVLLKYGEPMPKKKFFEECNRVYPQERGTTSYEEIWRVQRVGKGRFFGCVWKGEKCVGHISWLESGLSEEKLVRNDVNNNDDNVVKVLPIEVSNFMVSTDRDLSYLEVTNELGIIKAHMESGMPLILEGDKGLGKTRVLLHVAQEMGLPVVDCPCSEDTREIHLYGRYGLINDQSVYILGALTTAIELANQHGKAILILQEVNALPPNMQKVLNELTDFRRSIYVAAINKRFYLKEGNELCIFGTMNPSKNNYGGVFDLNEDMKSRWGILKFNYPIIQKEKEIINLFPDIASIPADIKSNVLKLAANVRDTSNNLEYILSTRDVINILRGFNAYKTVMGKEEALQTVLETYVVSRYDLDDDKRYIKQRISHIFGYTVVPKSIENY